jgi:hypothetical protein
MLTLTAKAIILTIGMCILLYKEDYREKYVIRNIEKHFIIYFNGYKFIKKIQQI